MRLPWLITVFMLLAVQGCVLYPTSRTYLEPNPADGVPTSSVSCGYNRASKDALVRDLGNLHIQVAPSYSSDKPIALSILLRSDADNVTVNPKLIHLKNVENGEIFEPSKINVTYQRPPRFDHFNRWIYIVYPVGSKKLRSISVQFNAGSVFIDGHRLDVDRFRFNKTEKFDIYYGLVNC